jgi:hypothetical protein
MTPSAPTGLSYASGPGRWVLLVTVLGSAMASIDATVVGIALPAIGRDFGASLTTLCTRIGYSGNYFTEVLPAVVIFGLGLPEAGPAPQHLLHCALDPPAWKAAVG